MTSLACCAASCHAACTCTIHRDRESIEDFLSNSQGTAVFQVVSEYVFVLYDHEAVYLSYFDPERCCSVALWDDTRQNLNYKLIRELEFCQFAIGVRDAIEGMQVGVLQSAAVARPGAQLLGKALQLGGPPQDHVGEGIPHTVAAAATALHRVVEEHRGTPPHGVLGRQGRCQKLVLVGVGSRHLSLPLVALPNPQIAPFSKCPQMSGDSSSEP